MDKFNHSAHKELWSWLAQNPELDKERWPGWKHNGGEYDVAAFYCFACEYAKFSSAKTITNCDACPLEWDEDENCTEENSLHKIWASTGNRRCRTFIAKEIRDLPVKKGVECI